MADLIIKASSNNDLVIQGSDDSPAITIGDTGTTTFAENATLSGTANNLGTVTAGSIAGGAITSATTFPAGHVIQVYKNGNAFTATGISAANSTSSDADGAGETISNVTAGNILIATVTSSYGYYSYNGASGYAMFRLGFSPNTGGDTFDDATSYYSRVHGNTPFYYQTIPVITCTYIIPSGVTSVEVLRQVQSDTASVDIHWAAPNSGVSKTKCVIMEVQG